MNALCKGNAFRTPKLLLVAVADGAIMAGPVGATLPILDGSEWSLA